MASHSNSYPLAWHYECLANQQSNLEREEIALKKHIDNVIRLRESLAFYKQQIETATLRGMDKFDSARMLRGKTQ
jgi:hypothetical protein